MLSSLLSAPCELKLHLLQHVIFLRPPTRRPTEDAPPTSTDEVARGLVELNVPQDRRIGGIRVKLRAVQSVAILPDHRDVVAFSGTAPIGWEDTVLMEKVVDIGVPPSKSHATIPGDDSISSAERRGRTRQTLSRTVTPTGSRPASPRGSEDLPPGYEETSSPVDEQTTTNTGLGAAIARALSRGRPLSRPGSRSNSQQASRSHSRAASRDVSPTRSAGGSSPRLRPTISNDSQADIDTICGHMSRTGLSNGRGENGGGGPHPQPADQHDYFGVVLNASSSAQGVGSSSVQKRSATLSPSRGKRRDESRIRFYKSGNRASSVDPNGHQSEGMLLQKGIHGFEFAFIIPADSAPYERSPYGRVRYVVKATAFGAGRAKSNLEAWRDMFPTVNPSTDGGPIPLTVLYHDMHPTVGLLSVACTANNISVGGIFNVDIHSPTPPQDLIVYLVRVSVETTTELRTRKKGKQQVPTQRHKLFEKGWVPPRPNDPHGQGDGKRSEGMIRDPTRPGCRPDDAWTVQGIARMPNDNIVRSTTIPGTRASIRFSHQLLVEVVHSREPEESGKDRKLKVFALRQPITLASCCVAYDAVTLPPYTRDDGNSRTALMPYDVGGTSDAPPASSSTPPPADGAPDRRPSTSARLLGVGHEFCVCGQTFDDLSERERALIPARPYSELPLDGISHRKIGELPEPQSLSATLGHAIHRTTSRSSSTSGREVDRARSRSRLRSLSRVRRSPSNGSTSPRRRSSRGASVTRVSSGRGGAGSAGPYANGAGERGEGQIISANRGARSGELPGQAQRHHFAFAPPPAYVNVEEDNEDASGADGSETGQAVVVTAE